MSSFDQLTTAVAVDPLDFARDGFPEPTLLPHLVDALDDERLPWLLNVTEIIGGSEGITPPWPRLVAAVSSRIGQRMRTASGDVNRQLLADSIAIYSHLPSELVELAVDQLGGSVTSWELERHADRVCRLAALHPDLGDGLLPELATATLTELPSDRMLNASAFLLPLTDAAERQAIVTRWLDPGWFDLAPLAALLEGCNPSERLGLSQMVLEFADQAGPGASIATLATVWPSLDPALVQPARTQLLAAWSSVRFEQPAWWLALVWSRLQMLDLGIELSLDRAANTFDPLDNAWRDWLDSLTHGQGSGENWTDVLRAHPGAADWVDAATQPDLSAGQLDGLLDGIMGRWGGMEAASRGDTTSEVPAPSPAPAPSAPPRVDTPTTTVPPPAQPEAPSRSGGVLDRLGGLLGGLFGSRDNNQSRSSPDDRRRGPLQSQPDPQVERKLQADVQLDDSGQLALLTSAFVAGASHAVDLSVGRGASLQVARGFVEPSFAAASDSEPLDLYLIHGDAVDTGRIELPRDRLGNSTVWHARLEVPAQAQRVEVTVVVAHKGRVLQTAKLSGRVVATLDEALTTAGTIEFAVIDNIHDLNALDERQAFDASVLTDGRRSTALAGTRIGVRELNGVDETIRKLTDKLFKTSEAVVMAGGSDDPAAYQKLLVFMATHGKLLHSMLIRQLMPALDDARRIQIVSTNPSAILPLEFVYSGPSPAHNATLCEHWREALAAGVCSSCDEQNKLSQPNQRSATICPLHFWSLSKVIERHATAEAEANVHDFLVGSRTGGSRDTLAPLERALFAASDNVPEALVDETLAAVEAAVPTCDEARTWSDWSTSIRARGPGLLVSMPHNALDPVLEISTLEIGRGSELRAGELTRDYVCGGDAEVGPIVLLLGCQTAHGGPQPFHTFVGEFRNNGAAVVIGTLATVLGEHAAPVVQAIVRELSAPADPDQHTLGERLLEMRRQMFAQGIVIALAVAAFGDADWALAGD